MYLTTSKHYHPQTPLMLKCLCFWDCELVLIHFLYCWHVHKRQWRRNSEVLIFLSWSSILFCSRYFWHSSNIAMDYFSHLEHCGVWGGRNGATLGHLKNPSEVSRLLKASQHCFLSVWQSCVKLHNTVLRKIDLGFWNVVRWLLRSWRWLLGYC